MEGSWSGGGGGFGGGAPGPSTWLETLRDLKNAAANIATSEDMWLIPDCAGDLNSITQRSADGEPKQGGTTPDVGSLIEAASSAQFNNATTTPNPVSKDSTVPASSQFVAGQYATAILNSNQQYWMPGSTLTLPLSQGPVTDARLDGMVLHELLHNMGYGDMDIQLSLMGPAGVTNKTDNISMRLSKDCFPER
jgi:hypothetical protein